MQQDGTCTSCPAGSISVYGSDSVTDCTPCSTGFYAVTDSCEVTVCNICPLGTYNSNPGMYGLDRCLACPLGRFCDSPGRVVGDRCPPATYTDQLGMTSCVHCAVPQQTWSEAKSRDECMPPIPIASAIWPAVSHINGGYTITIYGQYFQETVNITVGDVPVSLADIRVLNTTMATFVTPAVAEMGYYPVYLFNPSNPNDPALVC